MDVRNSIDGSLQISNEVVAKIAKLATLEIDGVARCFFRQHAERARVAEQSQPAKACYGGFKRWRCCGAGACNCQVRRKIMPVCAKVQENVKQTIQNMTGITVSRVDVIVAGLEEPAADQHK